MLSLRPGNLDLIQRFYFFDRCPESSLFISALTLGELRKGVEIKRRADPDTATLIADWVVGIEQKFADRVIPVDAAVDQRCGELAADRTCPVIDTLIAATAVVHDLTLVTRNTDDVAGINIKTINPWI